MKITVVSQVGVVPCENRNLTSLEDTDLLPDSLGSLCFVLSVQNSCGECGDSLNYILNSIHNQGYSDITSQQGGLCKGKLSNPKMYLSY